MFGNKDKALKQLENAIKVERMYSRGRSDHMEKSLQDLLGQTQAMVREGRTEESVQLIQASRGMSGEAGDNRWNRVVDVAVEQLNAVPEADPELAYLRAQLEKAWWRIYLSLWVKRDPEPPEIEQIRQAIAALAERCASNGKAEEARRVLDGFRRDPRSRDRDFGIMNDVLDQALGELPPAVPA